MDTKTKIYLFPILKSFGEDFIKDFTSLKIHNVFINDLDYLKAYNKSYFEPLLFVVVDRNLHKIKELKKYKNMIDHYIYEWKSDKEIIVFKLPNEYKISFLKFLQSKYSEMYSNHQVNTLFSDTDLRHGVFNKKEERRKQFQKKLKEMYDVEIIIDDDRELDLPINLSSEVLRWEEIYHFIYLNSINNGKNS